jgi:hypothetical protein
MILDERCNLQLCPQQIQWFVCLHQVTGWDGGAGRITALSAKAGAPDQPQKCVDIVLPTLGSKDGPTYINGSIEPHIQRYHGER